MKALFVLAITALVSLPALAYSNGPYERYPYYSTSVSCSELKQAVADAGALVIYSSRSIYDAYVQSSYYCSMGETTQAAYVPAADGNCLLKKCAMRDHGR
jgi:hypothetical protein